MTASVWTSSRNRLISLDVRNLLLESFWRLRARSELLAFGARRRPLRPRWCVFAHVHLLSLDSSRKFVRSSRSEPLLSPPRRATDAPLVTCSALRRPWPGRASTRRRRARLLQRAESPLQPSPVPALVPTTPEPSKALPVRRPVPMSRCRAGSRPLDPGSTDHFVRSLSGCAS